MKQTIGFIEFRSIAKGVEATDVMLKSGNVSLIYSNVLCPGKFLVMLSGDVSAVENAITVGANFDPTTYLDSDVIANVHSSLIPAITATTPVVQHDALGIIETANICASIIAADTAAKTSKIDLLEIRLARGMGGKGYVSLCGDISAVNSAVQKASVEVGKRGMLITTSVIASPHKDLVF